MDTNTALVLLFVVPISLAVVYRLTNDFFDHRQRMARIRYDSLVLQNKLKRAVENDSDDTAPPSQK